MQDNMSNLPATRSDSLFTTFEGEVKPQLVSVCIKGSEFLLPILELFSFLV